MGGTGLQGMGRARGAGSQSIKLCNATSEFIASGSSRATQGHAESGQGNEVV